MINVKCKTCSKSMKVPDKFAGRKGKCKYCKSPVMVPKLPADDDDLIDVDMEEEDDFGFQSSASMPQRSRSTAPRKKVEDDLPQTNYIQPKEYAQQKRFETGFLVKAIAGGMFLILGTIMFFVTVNYLDEVYEPTDVGESLDAKQADIQKHIRVEKQKDGAGARRIGHPAGANFVDEDEPNVLDNVKPGIGLALLMSDQKKDDDDDQERRIPAGMEGPSVLVSPNPLGGGLIPKQDDDE